MVDDCELLCLLCSSKGIERKRKSATNNRDFQEEKRGVCCPHCSQFTCDKCLRSFHNVVTSSPAKFVPESNAWTHAVGEYLSGHGWNPSIRGHCCNLKEIEDVSPPIFQDKGEGSVHLGGHIFFPDFNCIVDSPFTCMDVHGLGSEETLSPVWHCVFPQGTQAFTAPSIPPAWTVLAKDIQIRLPHVPDTSPNIQKYSLRVVRIPKGATPFLRSRIGHNTPSREELLEAHVLQFPWFSGPRKKATDPHRVTIVLGEEHSCSSANLLLMRFHDLNPRDITCPKQQEELFECVWKLLGDNKQETRRTGGSSGLCRADLAFFEMLQRAGTVPRRATSTLWMKRSDRAWHWFYRNTTEGEIKDGYYSNPVSGGSFQFKEGRKKGLRTSDLLTRFKVLVEFISIKPISAMILDELNQSNHGKPATPVAVSSELSKIHEARKRTDRFCKVSPMKESARKRAFYSYYTMQFCNNTLVLHPVGFHLDRFAGNRPSLENKVCFLNAGRINMGPGRGGAIGKYTFALLDWEGNKRKIRTIWMDPVNADLPGGRNAYPGVQNMTQDIRVLFHNMNGDLFNNMPVN